MSVDSYPAPFPARLRGWMPRTVAAPLRRLLALPELIGLLGLAGVLNLWNLSINGWANTYYAAAVKSMSSSWHDFLFASLDKSGLMTVDKPPLALWVQALSARVFGLGSLSILLPQALMGIVAVGLVYDIVRRRFGRLAGFAGGLAMATTPIAVAVARHNNPDELLVLLTVAAIWFALRALETGATKHLVWCGVFVGLGFETKMGVALMVVPAIALAYFWVAPRGRWRSVRQLLAGGVSLAVVGLAWPILVTLTPAADRPWISGTSDNSIWSLIFGYNGLGRVSGQAGGPQALGGGGGGGGSLFGGATGPFRLLQSGLGDQAGWLLGLALVTSVGLIVVSRLRRRDPNTGFVIVLAGSLLTAGVVFSFASGIFHPYYVSYLAPLIAALVGAGAGMMLSGGRASRIFAPVAIARRCDHRARRTQRDQWLPEVGRAAGCRGQRCVRCRARAEPAAAGAGRCGRARAGGADGSAGDMGGVHARPRNQQHVSGRRSRELLVRRRRPRPRRRSEWRRRSGRRQRFERRRRSERRRRVAPLRRLPRHRLPGRRRGPPGCVRGRWRRHGRGRRRRLRRR